jgi:glycosyltransferase involved in cell wall biosynthesis
MKRFNIALIHYSCPPVIGGVEEILRQQASLFHRNYHQVKIVAGCGDQFTLDYPVEINPILHSQHPQILQIHQKLLNGYSSKLESLINKIYFYLSKTLEGYDILIAHNILTMNFNLPLTIAVHRLAESNNIKIIAWNHDSPYFYPDYPPFLDNPPWNILKSYHPNIHYVAISQTRKKQFQKLYGPQSKVKVIPDGIDPIGFFQLNPLTVKIIKEKNLFEADLLMVQPSRLTPRKNIELSIKVLKSLKDRGIRVYLLLTGVYDPHLPKTKSYYYKLRDLAKNLKVEKDIIFLAEYTLQSRQKLIPNRTLIRDLYLIADLLFMPSIQEGFGIPLLEAGMIKLPIVCSNIGPFKEIGGNEVCLFNLSDSHEKIAEKIIHFLEKLPTHNFYRKVIKNYTWDIIYKFQLFPFLKEISEK